MVLHLINLFEFYLFQFLDKTNDKWYLFNNKQCKSWSFTSLNFVRNSFFSIFTEIQGYSFCSVCTIRIQRVKEYTPSSPGIDGPEAYTTWGEVLFKKYNISLKIHIRLDTNVSFDKVKISKQMTQIRKYYILHKKAYSILANTINFTKSKTIMVLISFSCM